MKTKLVPNKIKHRFTLDASDDPVALCSLEPFMNYQLPKQPQLVRSWDEVTCGFCHHLQGAGRRAIDRTLKAVN